MNKAQQHKLPRAKRLPAKPSQGLIDLYDKALALRLCYRYTITDSEKETIGLHYSLALADYHTARDNYSPPREPIRYHISDFNDLDEPPKPKKPKPYAWAHL